jgi:hypothetical protein
MLMAELAQLPVERAVDWQAGKLNSSVCLLGLVVL